ncbi:probable NAD(P)H dehydrogenase subunit CRR3, chloroplastic [Rhodamnia argentea]|uniref:Probable NAD(P)H dehydrogenase subunit CRR3, chloroplastic n=1 Tax=Rhodamnia argentea TaxID=178133 RepID=A0A8B8MYB9_9MYRT|nr:probable NAD(P)H dehydrogenase subunit CRR3, chloroplastic [Rhodamnia argentea]
MPCLTCVPIATPRASVHASLADDRSSPSIPHGKVYPKPSSPRIRTAPTPPGSKQKKTQKQQPTIVEIERAIGAGWFSDADPKKLEQRKSVLDGVLPTDGWKVESSVERKLRESGEWILDQTERRPASAGKSILVAVFQWVLPAWVLMLLVASGAVKLPFRVPFLDDLIM